MSVKIRVLGVYQYQGLLFWNYDRFFSRLYAWKSWKRSRNILKSFMRILCERVIQTYCFKSRIFQFSPLPKNVTRPSFDIFEVTNESHERKVGMSWNSKWHTLSDNDVDLLFWIKIFFILPDPSKMRLDPFVKLVILWHFQCMLL